MTNRITHTGKVWLWTTDRGPASWHFLTIDGAAGEAIAAHEAMRRLELGSGRGFGSVKVSARIGETCWSTSVFLSKDAGGYILPLKASVRKAEDLAEGGTASVQLELL